MQKTAKPIKKKSCQAVGCKNKFTPRSTTQAACGLKCAISIAENNHKKEQKKSAKLERAKHREAKAKVKPKQKWLSELQAEFNKYVRLRDAQDGCISCDKPASWDGQWHASHYYSRGHSSYLRFNLWNVHKSCSVCNNYLSGNIGEFTPRLIEKIGRERFDWLEANKSNLLEVDVNYIRRAIKVTRRAVKRLERK